MGNHPHHQPRAVAGKSMALAQLKPTALVCLEKWCHWGKWQVPPPVSTVLNRFNPPNCSVQDFETHPVIACYNRLSKHVYIYIYIQLCTHTHVYIYIHCVCTICVSKLLNHHLQGLNVFGIFRLFLRLKFWPSFFSVGALQVSEKPHPRSRTACHCYDRG